MDDLTADQVFDASPGELFGGLDDRELRRRYAKLAKRFRGDAKVSQHLRRMYEWVRDGHFKQATAAEEVAEVSAPLSPEAQLMAALTSRQTAEVERLFVDVHGELAQRSPGWVIDFAQQCMRAPWVPVGEAFVEAVERVLVDPRLEVAPELLGDLWDWSALGATVGDPVAEPVLHALLPVWSAPLSQRLEAVLAIRDDVLGTDAALASLRAASPVLYGRLRRLESEADAVLSGQPLPVPEAELAELRVRYAPRQQYTPQRAYAKFLGLVPCPGIAQHRMKGLPLVAILVGLTLVFLVLGYQTQKIEVLRVSPIFGLTLLVVVRHLAREAVTRAEQDGAEPLVEVCRKYNLFPRSFARRLPAQMPALRLGVAYSQRHGLQLVDEYPWLWLHLLSPEHVRRVQLAEGSDA